MLKKKKLVKKKLSTEVDSFWGDTKTQLERGTITPFVSNFISARIFDLDPADVAESWAEDEEVASPLSGQANRQLAQVAQYYSVQESARAAKTHYLASLTGFLLGLVDDDDDLDPDLLEEIEETAAKKSFSEIAYQLGYPKFSEAQQNPLRLLAELPLPIYLTTSYHDFLEVALSRANKSPVSEIFYWDDTLYHIPSIYNQEPDYQPSKERPLVYHLYGLDKYPESLVLTEDDYLDFLIKASAENFEVHHSEQQKRMPSSVLKALSGTSLMLLGYDVYGWEFRALFRGLIKARNDSRANNRNIAEGISMQIGPGQDYTDPAKVKTYLAKYFKQSHFKVYWGDLESCIQDLWKLWKG